MKLTSTLLLLILSVFIVAIFAVNYTPSVAVRNMATLPEESHLALLPVPSYQQDGTVVT